MTKRTPKTVGLYEAVNALRSPKEVENFLADLCTPAEIKAFEERWAIAQALNTGESNYRDIAAKLHASTTTVTRVARFLFNERHQGYRLILDRLS
jgi:TrpR-related protein YerC/YecD